ncbi:MAG: hypothetical protein KatS3mg102_1748 [Planctomycetota bacterium]|nr:MAG: hypothetical protein KatS3mg102_1748 [Planctomycetota bacterium]
MSGIAGVSGMRPPVGGGTAGELRSAGLASDPAIAGIAAGEGVPLGRGARGESVRTLQRALLELGYELPRYGADGGFGAETEAALRAFQRDAGLQPTGRLDQATVRALDARLAGGGGAEGAPGAAGPALHGPLAGEPTLARVAAGELTLASGSRGPAVRILQEQLNALGMDAGRADGWYGNRTAGAVRRLQAAAGLPQTGVLDAATVRALDARLAATGSDSPAAVEDGTSYPGAGAPGIQNPRFAGADLAAVAAGRTTLGPGARGEGVRQLQQALLDLGFRLPRYGADGGYGAETVHAVRQFQLEMGLPRTGRVDRATLEALDRVAPPPGKMLERRPDYEALFEDGRLDMTIAFGYDEHGTTPGTVRSTLRGLTEQGFRRIDPQALAAEERERLGLSGERYLPGASYYHRRFTDPETGRPIDAVVRVITPDSDPDPANVAAMFRRALEQDEVVIYDGHARYGTGPDFDDIHSGRGNFVIDERGNPPDSHASRPPDYLRNAIRGRDTDLAGTGGPGRYQLLYFNACSTENYLPNLRERFPGRNTANTDIVTTTLPTYIASGPEHVLNFVSGLTGRASMNAIEERAARVEVGWMDYFDERDAVRRAYGENTLVGSGFIGNRGNRVVDRP